MLGYNEDYLKLPIRFNKDVGKARKVLACFPPFLRRIAYILLANTRQRVKECQRLIEPVVLERMAFMDEFKDKWNDKPVSVS